MQPVFSDLSLLCQVVPQPVPRASWLPLSPGLLRLSCLLSSGQHLWPTSPLAPHPAQFSSPVFVLPAPQTAECAMRTEAHNVQVGTTPDSRWNSPASEALGGAWKSLLPIP